METNVSVKKSNAQKKLEGTLRPGRTNVHEPKAIVGVPDVDMDHMPALAREWFPKLASPLVEQGTLTVADGANFSLLVCAWAQVIEAEQLIQAAGGPIYTTRTETGSIIYRPHPAVAMRAEAHKRFVTLSARFGMTPADRLRVPAYLEEPKTINPFDDI